MDVFTIFSFRLQIIEKVITQCMKWSFVKSAIVSTKGMIRMPIQQNSVASAETNYPEIQRKFEEFENLRKRCGKFFIRKDAFVWDLESIYFIFNRVIPVRCEYLVYMDSFEYVGWSEYFDGVSYLVDVPLYTISVKPDENGKRILEVIRET